jgi:hypothetical protein
MVELLKFFPLITLILTHPLEQLSLVDYLAPNSTTSFFHGSNYVASSNGIIKEIFENDGLFKVILSLDDGIEVVYSDLTGIAKKSGDRVTINEIIGVDNTISSNTKFILMFYNKSELFPQFKQKNLTFHINSSTNLYMTADGTCIFMGYVVFSEYSQLFDIYNDIGFYTHIENGKAIPQSFIPGGEPGLFIQVKLPSRYTYISYWHLRTARVNKSYQLNHGDLIATSGNSGVLESPRLVLHINDEELGDDIRVIYLRLPIVSEN